MRCPRLSELPPPPPDKSGWPWTAETPPLPDSAGAPVISVVTPSFNQGQYLEETIRSVLLQGYPALEYIVIDGGSTDQSVVIIQKYAQWLTIWKSERDEGQAHAINKGLAHCTGAIFNWLNSDDYLAPGALRLVVESFQNDVDAVAGTVMNFDNHSSRRVVQAKLVPAHMVAGEAVYQQQGFWLRRERVTSCGGMDESLHLAFDWDLALRYLSRWPCVVYTEKILAHFRFHADSKTCTQEEKWEPERQRVACKLRDQATDPALRDACNLRIRNYNWWTTVASARADNNRPAWARAGYLLGAACRDPKVRWTRFTLGAVRRLLFT